MKKWEVSKMRIGEPVRNLKNEVQILNFTVKSIENGIIIENLQDFDPIHTFECGQCFRWNIQEDGSYIGVALGKVVKVLWNNKDLTIINTNIDEFNRLWIHYFDLNRDYTRIKEILAKDPVLKAAIDFGYGIRLLKQDFNESLISFIISSNNHIPRIKKIIETLSRQYGNELVFDGTRYYSFPAIESFAKSDIEQIGICKAGYRCEYILKTAQQLVQNGIDLAAVSKMDTYSARKSLMQFSGVGPKVADCVLLFSGLKYDVFPTDVWVRKVMKELYFGYEPKPHEIISFSDERFGDLAGFAQQYLFYYARSHLK